ncbi:type I restriction enzyme, R subunit [Cryobacterium psychrotolerans]|uniref:Type I restriction enzyme endonuclease subunit n=1 Tax=Cryobacterium psychrotolerans TaxID=386301 RepID=A0A1G9BAX6_9MICO|nr:HsdR family type I site-specific deoxyribonuclease [Cryobacterium psychrotolerans]TFD84687.1 type I restriction endonuclease subunit R [Cryobacterium psychrotolerans]SDK36589.1 type I restriction enzyme, R subunit [Cryobacterium psychrotolerans]
MSGYTEKGTVQAALVQLLVGAGWTYVAGKDLPRTTQQVFIEADLRDTIERLNPALVGRTDAVLAKVRQVALSAASEGLMGANEQFTKLLRGGGTVLMPDTNHDEPFQLLDFEHPERNALLVSDEVSYLGARFDVVLWVNGIPVIVGETKTPVSVVKSWKDGAKDIYTAYEEHQPAFFTPNLLSFATEGKDFRYAGVRTPLDHWERWGSSAVPATIEGWDRVKMSVTGLLSPTVVLNLIEHYAMYDLQSDDGAVRTIKLLPRYFQYESVEKIVARATSEPRSRGLIYHTQGSGKTLTMSWVATRLYFDPRMHNPTIVAVADRTQLVTQTFSQFASAGVPAPVKAASTAALQSALRGDERGIIATTVHKFKDAGLLSARENIVVLVDEAHRTQEGALGADMRSALPNAHRFGFTGTPVADLDRNTYQLFGDERDSGWALDTYDSDRSIADGTTVPMRVIPRPVRFDVAKAELDAAFDTLAEEEELTDAQKESFSRRVANARAIFHNPERITAVAFDVVDHFYKAIEPHGMKAQVVVADQELCVLYDEALRGALTAAGRDDQSAVVISATGKAELDAFKMSEGEEEVLLDRFRDATDPLKFLIVTAKLGTGFNAPIEGVLYLDKPLKLHTLFQTITRTNRPWRNPQTGFTKRYGTIVDYVGLGGAFARAIAPSDPEHAQRQIDTDGLLAGLDAALKEMRRRFVGITRDGTMGSLQAALERLPANSEDRAEYRAEFLYAQGLWETLAPDERLSGWEDDYTWYAQVYAAIPTGGDEDDILWERLGPKTRELVHQHMRNVRVDDRNIAVVIADAETIRKMTEAGQLPPVPKDYVGKSAQEIVDSLTARIRRKLEGGGHHAVVYGSIAERLDQLRQRVIATAEDSVVWLTRLFEVANDLKTAEEADGDGVLADLPDPNIGMLTRIFEENTPEGMTVMVGQIVAEIDTLVRHAVHEKWTSKESSMKAVKRELNALFKRYSLPRTGEPMDSAWRYILKHY